MTPKAVNVNNIDLEKEKDKVTEDPGLIEFPHTIGSAIIKPEDLGKIKGKAVAAMEEQTQVQMKQLYDQMQTLASQARAIKARVAVSIRIYQARINFDPVMGNVYYLYQRNDGSDVLSMISPEEWGKSIPFERMIAKVRLLFDHTWEVLEGEINP